MPLELLFTPENITLSGVILALFLSAWNTLQGILEKKGGKWFDNWIQSAKVEREMTQAQTLAAIEAETDKREQTQLMQLRAFESSNQTMAALLEELTASNEFMRTIVTQKVEGIDTAIVRVHARIDKIEQLGEMGRQQYESQIKAITEGHKEAMSEIGITMTVLSEKVSAWTDAVNLLNGKLSK